MKEVKQFSDAGVAAAAAILDELAVDVVRSVSEAVERGATLRVALDITPDGGSQVRLELVSDGRAVLVASLAGRHSTSLNAIQRH
jgi:hypothetical protein